MNKYLLLLIITIICYAFVGLMLFITHKLVKEKYRKYFFIFSALLCVFLHYSYFIFERLKGNNIEMARNLYIPMWPCNIIMWLNLILCFLVFFKKKNAVINCLFDITFWVGTICAAVGIAFNFNFLDTPDIKNWDIMKGVLSHVPLLYCCIFSFVEGYTDYKASRIFIALVVASLLFIGCGNFAKYYLIKVGDPGGTMMDPVFDNIPWLNLYVILPVAFIAFLIGATIYEIIKYPKEKRWYNKLFKKGK